MGHSSPWESNKATYPHSGNMTILKYPQNFAENFTVPLKPFDHLGILRLQGKNPEWEGFSRVF